jgi:hypothetical protein
MTITKHAALLLLTLVGLTGLLSAQRSTAVKAQVPFAFVANGQTMPAGECTIAVLVNGRTLLSINSGKQHTFAVPIGDKSSSTPKKTALVFHHYANRYFLVALRREGGISYQLPASTLERELQALNVPSQVFTLVASAQ